VLAATHVDQVPVGRVEVEVAVELRLVRLAGVPAVTALLFGAEEPLTAPLGQPRLVLNPGQPARSAPGLGRRYW